MKNYIQEHRNKWKRQERASTRTERQNAECKGRRPKKHRELRLTLRNGDTDKTPDEKKTELRPSLRSRNIDETQTK